MRAGGVVQVGLEVDETDDRRRGSHARLHRVDRVGERRDGVARELELRREQHVVGAEVQRAQVDDARDLGAGEDRVADVGRRLPGATASPMSRLFISIASTTAITPSSSPMPMLPIASHRGLPVISARLMPTSANNRPIERAGVLEQHDGELGALGRADEAPPRATLTARRGFAARGAQRPGLRARSRRRARRTRQIGESSSCGSMSFWMPSYSANIDPSVNSTSATMNAQK